MLFRDTSLITEFGNDATIPANISIEIPLPIPFFVIFSPSHTKNAVPAKNDITTVIPVIHPGFINNPCLLYAIYNPAPCINASIKVIIFVYLFIFCFPCSPPSFIIISSDGNNIPNNCTIIDAEIYGLIDIAKTDSLANAPPVIKLIIPKSPLLAVFITPSSLAKFTNGTLTCVPNLKIINNNIVNNNLFLTSGTFHAFIIVLNN